MSQREHTKSDKSVYTSFVALNPSTAYLHRKKSTLHLNILQAYPRYEEWMNTIAKAIEPLIDSAPPDLPQLLEWKWANIKDNLNQIKALSTTSESVDKIFFSVSFVVLMKSMCIIVCVHVSMCM